MITVIIVSMVTPWSNLIQIIKPVFLVDLPLPQSISVVFMVSLLTMASHTFRYSSMSLIIEKIEIMLWCKSIDGRTFECEIEGVCC